MGAVVACLIIGFAWTWAWSWLPYVVAIAGTMLLLARMQFGSSKS
jgi:hypothetical protein